MQLEVLVLEGVGQLVRERDAHVGRQLGAEHEELVRLLVVEAEDLGAEQAT